MSLNKIRPFLRFKVLTHLNVHSGCDSWSEEKSVKFFGGILDLSRSFLAGNPHVGAAARGTLPFGATAPYSTPGTSNDSCIGGPSPVCSPNGFGSIGISHETHRGRILHHPRAALRFLGTSLRDSLAHCMGV